MAKAKHAPAKPVESTPFNSTAQKATPDESQIAAAAYHLWQERGCPIGSDQEDWFRAEVLLKDPISA